jgi:hypothetical protein
MADFNFREVEICGHTFYVSGGILYDRKNESCWLDPISPKDLTTLILIMNDMLLESEC